MKPGIASLANIRHDVMAIKDEVIALRRDFHRHPEPGFGEVRTSGAVVKWLESLGGFEIRKNVAQTGVVADIYGPGRSGPFVALRADMDALQIPENNPDLDYASENPGLMHACGHDAHTASLMGVAKLLSRNRDQLKGGVRLIFQPAEEGPGGAEPMIAEGVLENPVPDAIYAFHVWSSLPTGYVNISPGPVMASTDELRFTITGKGGHGAVPQETVDPIVTAAHFVVALQTLVSRNVNPIDSAVLSIGKIRGGAIMNAIADEVVMDGTLRTYLPETRELLHRRLNELGEGIDRTFGTSTNVEIFTRYPAVINDPERAEVALKLARDICGDEAVQSDLRLMGGEDMAFYFQKVPGCFIFLGVGNSGKGCDYPHHNPKFNIDEDGMLYGMELLLRLVESHME